MGTTARRSGFTLIELLAVMAVIAILAGIVLGISGYATFKSDKTKTEADIEHIRQLLQEYRADHGVMPPDSSWKNAIKELDETFYIETDRLKDRWGHEYKYKRDTTKYVAYIWSMGPDGRDSRWREERKDNIGEWPH